MALQTFGWICTHTHTHTHTHVQVTVYIAHTNMHKMAQNLTWSLVSFTRACADTFTDTEEKHKQTHACTFELPARWSVISNRQSLPLQTLVACMLIMLLSRPAILDSACAAVGQQPCLCSHPLIVRSSTTPFALRVYFDFHWASLAFDHHPSRELQPSGANLGQAILGRSAFGKIPDLNGCLVRTISRCNLSALQKFLQIAV